MELSARLPPMSVWADEPGLRAYLNWLEEKGVKELVWTPEPAALSLVERALNGRPFTLAVVLPNMSLYARDAMDAGPTGAVLKRFRALGPVGLIQLGLRLLPQTPALLEKRFSAGIMLLADAEFLRLKNLPVERVLLHNSAADMALALGNRELFAAFASWARSRGVDGSVLTSNLWMWDGTPSGLALRESSGGLSWEDYRPETPGQRLAVWKKRAQAA